MKDVFACALTIVGLLTFAVLMPPFQSRSTDAQILRAKTFAENEPFLALDGTEPARLHEAIRELEETREILAKTQKDHHDAELVRYALYPIAFLRALAELEERRLAFVASGSSADWRAYERALDIAVWSYQRDLTRFQDAFKEVVPEDARPFAAGSWLITRETTLQALDELDRGMKETRSRIHERRACIMRDEPDCGDGLARVAPYEPPAEISAREQAIVRNVRSIYIGAGWNLSRTLEIPKGRCTAALPGAGFFAIRDDSVFMPVYLGDMRLVDAKEQSSVPFYGFLAEQGPEYAFSSPFPMYSCPEFAEEFSRILGALHDDENASPSDLSIANSSVAFDEIVRYVAYTETAIRRANERGAPGATDAATLFYVRSAFPALFAAHNPSVAGTYEPFFTLHKIPADEQPFVFYSALPQTTATISSLVQSIKAFDAVHAPLP